MIVPRVSFSHLKHMADSPAHYVASLTKQFTESSPMRIGSAADLYIFGGTEPVVFEGKTRNGKAWEEFQLENADRCIINLTEYRAAKSIADAVLADPNAMEVLQGRTFQTVEWNYLGMRDCVSHPDLIGHDFITDLKTSVSANPWKFTRQALRMSYHAQLAFYREAVADAAAWRARECYIVVAENSAPYAVTTLRLTTRALEAGDKLNRLWMERLLVAEKYNDWPGYVSCVVDLDVEDTELELTFETADGELVTAD